MLTISRPLATRLLKQAQSSPEATVGGVLLARAGEPCDIRPMASNGTNFDAHEFASIADQAHAEGLEPLAFYLSHPDSPPTPTAADLAARPAPELPLLLISLDIKGVLEMRAFMPEADSVRESPVQIFL